MRRSRDLRRTPAEVSTRKARRAAGRALRRKVSRSAHAQWSPGKDRPDPVELLRAQDSVRIPELRPTRYGRMASSPFEFLRGAATVMAHDFANTPATGLRVQLCGDAHVNNFGLYGTPERDQVFDANDFDETLPGPWEWDVKRLATSLVLAGRQNRFERTENRKAARVAVQSYREMMSAFSSMRYLDGWYFHIDLATQGIPRQAETSKVIGRSVAKARRETNFHSFPKLAEASKRGTARIRENPPLTVHYRDPAEFENSSAFYERYRTSLPEERRMLLERYHVVDVAQRVVGVGSVGLACSVLLLMADSDVEDPLFLQLKQATTSALEPVLGPSRYSNHAQRVVVGQHLIQEASDVFLGWSRLRSRDFYVRQLHDMRFSYDLSSLGPKAFARQARLCGAALARAHARTGDPARISGYLGRRGLFDVAVATFAESYADQTERDFRALRSAIKSGRVASDTNV
jgi:uncharacterized protein (DUF2252 family)